VSIRKGDYLHWVLELHGSGGQAYIFELLVGELDVVVRLSAGEVDNRPGREAVAGEGVRGDGESGLVHARAHVPHVVDGQGVVRLQHQRRVNGHHCPADESRRPGVVDAECSGHARRAPLLGSRDGVPVHFGPARSLVRHQRLRAIHPLPIRRSRVDAPRHPSIRVRCRRCSRNVLTCSLVLLFQ
jgi:hypothetical protein